MEAGQAQCWAIGAVQKGSLGGFPPSCPCPFLVKWEWGVCDGRELCPPCSIELAKEPVYLLSGSILPSLLSVLGTPAPRHALMEQGPVVGTLSAWHMKEILTSFPDYPMPFLYVSLGWQPLCSLCKVLTSPRRSISIIGMPPRAI